MCHLRPALQALNCSSSMAKHLPDVVRDMLLPAVKLFCWTGSTHYLTPRGLCQVPRPAFAKLYTVSCHRIAPGLVCNLLDC